MALSFTRATSASKGVTNVQQAITVAVDDVVFVAAGGSTTAPTDISDSLGHTWQQVASGASMLNIEWTRVTTAGSMTVTATTSTSTNQAYAINIVKVSGASTTQSFTSSDSLVATTGTATGPSLATPTAVGDGILAFTGINGPTGDVLVGDTDALEGAWSAIGSDGTSGQGAASNVRVATQWKTVTGTSQQSHTCTISARAARDYSVAIVAVVPPVAKSASDTASLNITELGDRPLEPITGAFYANNTTTTPNITAPIKKSLSRTASGNTTATHDSGQASQFDFTHVYISGSGVHNSATWPTTGYSGGIFIESLTGTWSLRITRWSSDGSLAKVATMALDETITSPGWKTFSNVSWSDVNAGSPAANDCISIDLICRSAAGGRAVVRYDDTKTYLYNAEFSEQAPATPISGSDTASLTITDSGSLAITAVKSGSDTSSVAIAETSSLFITKSAGDTSSVSLAESMSNSVTLSRSDTSAVSISESQTTLVSRSATDTSSVTIADSSAILASVAKTASDVATVAISDSSSTAVTLSRTDTAALSVADTSSSFKTLTASDTWSVAISEVASAGNSMLGSDASAVGIAESRSLDKFTTTSDTAALTISESTTISVTVLRTDTASVSIAESNTRFVTKVATDAGSLAITESSTSAITTEASDTTAVIVTEFTSFDNTASSSDAGSLSITDSSSIIEPGNYVAKARVGNQWISGTIKVYLAGQWVEKPVKIYREGSWS